MFDIFAPFAKHFAAPQPQVNKSQKKQFIALSEKLMNSDLKLTGEDIAEMLFAYALNNNMGLSFELIEEFSEKINHRALTTDGCLEAYEEVFEGELA